MAEYVKMPECKVPLNTSLPISHASLYTHCVFISAGTFGNRYTTYDSLDKVGQPCEGFCRAYPKNLI